MARRGTEDRKNRSACLQAGGVRLPLGRSPVPVSQPLPPPPALSRLEPPPAGPAVPGHPDRVVLQLPGLLRQRRLQGLQQPPRWHLVGEGARDLWGGEATRGAPARAQGPFIILPVSALAPRSPCPQTCNLMAGRKYGLAEDSERSLPSAGVR